MTPTTSVMVQCSLLLVLAFLSSTMDYFAAALKSEPWPGPSSTDIVDYQNEFPPNLSGLMHETDPVTGQEVMFTIANKPSVLHKLFWNGTYWLPSQEVGWFGKGKPLFFSDGKGDPDTEDLTRGDISVDPYSIYTCVEQDNSAFPKVGNLSVLQYSLVSNAELSPSLVAVRQWLISDFPSVPVNYGFEAITFIPDQYLTANNFFDEKKNKKYNPSDYPNHGTGLFFLGLESDGKIYAYALMLNGEETSVAQVSSIRNFDVSIMSLQFDKDSSLMWALCDNTCTSGNNIATYLLNSETGKFDITHMYEQPKGLPLYNNEGFAILRDSSCVNSEKAVYFVDDDNNNGYSLRRAHLDCN